MKISFIIYLLNMKSLKKKNKIFKPFILERKTQECLKPFIHFILKTIII